MSTTELTTPPALLPMYAKAALTGPLHRGDSLPDSIYTLADQAIDVDHLTAYNRVCGFGVSDVLSPTYLHVLAYPLSVALMTERAFPFPLVGAVHVANSITVHRPVHVTEQVSFTVRAADLRPHSAGRQFDLIAEARVDDELVWSGRSTYLRRGKPSGEKKPKSESTALEGPVSLVRAPGDTGRRYAKVSGDSNPIHMSSLSAKAFGFPSAIAHGMWLKARTLASLEGALPSAFTVDVAFKLPVLLPTTVGIVAEADGAGWTIDVRNPRSGKPHMAGTVTTNEQPRPAVVDAATAAEAGKASAKKAATKKATAAATKAPAAKKAAARRPSPKSAE